MKPASVLLILIAAVLASPGGDVQDLEPLEGQASAPFDGHAGPQPAPGATAAGWSDAAQALGASGSASTRQDGSALRVSGFAAGAATITAVTVHAKVSQQDHSDDGLRLVVTAPGCAGIDQPLPLSSTAVDHAVTMPCAWTRAALQGAQVTLTSQGQGGLLGVGRIDGDWHTHHVWLEVTTQNGAPSAQVTGPASALEGTVVALDASTSSDPDQDALSFQWTQTAGPVVALSSQGDAASFSAPALSSNRPVTLVFEVRATDGAGHSATAPHQVQIHNLNQPPVARAGPDQAMGMGTTVVDASASSDADGDTLSYAWSQLSGPSADMSSQTQSSIAITPQAGTAVFRVTVSDGHGGASSDDVTITAAPSTSPGADTTPGSPPGTTAPPTGTTPTTTPSGTPSQDPGSDGVTLLRGGTGSTDAPGETPAGGPSVGAQDGGARVPGQASPGTTEGERAPGTTSDWMAAQAGAWWPWAAGLLAVGLVSIVPTRRVLAARRPPVPERPQIILGDLDQEVRNDEIIQFLNNASHDLASPLTPIRIQLAMLENVEGDLTDRQKKAWDVVKRNIDQMGLLVTDIRDAARMQAGQLALYPEAMDVAQLVADSVESFEGPAAEKGVTLTMDHDGSALEVDGDAGRLTQVLYNLLNNALKFSESGGRVQVVVRSSEPDQVLVAIRDTGIGMTEEDAARLFQPFSQAHAAAQKKKGSGLGLFISKGIIEGHGGDIWCQSAGPGKGSVFAFTLKHIQPAMLVEQNA